VINLEKQFKPIPSKLCQYCMFKNFCPAKDKIKKYIDQPVADSFVEDLPF